MGSSRLRTKAKIRFIEFVRPDDYWPDPYTIEQAFHVYQWMIRTGDAYSPYGASGVYDLLTCKPTCINIRPADAILSLNDLRRRFHHAILSRYASKHAQEWRQAEGIWVTGERTLSFRHHAPFKGTPRWRCEADIEEAIKTFFQDGSTKRTGLSLNKYHPTARTCKSVQILVTPKGFYFILEYGWPADECTSHWFHELAEGPATEPFLDGLGRAIDALSALTAPEQTEIAA